MVNHDTLRWQFQYGGLKLINLRILVCPECYDQPQIQLRTIILPPDPQPIEFSLPEEYPGTDNPVSGVGFSLQALTRPTVSGQTLGANIGTLTAGAGLNGAFDGVTGQSSSATIATKLSAFCATALQSVSGLNNFVGKNWNAPDNFAAIPSSLITIVSYSVSSFTVIGPTDQPITAASSKGIQLQGSSDGITWNVLFSGTLAGVNGEVFSGLPSGGNFQQHRIAISGDGTSPIYVAQAAFNVLTTGQNEE